MAGLRVTWPKFLEARRLAIYRSTRRRNSRRPSTSRPPRRSGSSYRHLSCLLQLLTAAFRCCGRLLYSTSEVRLRAALPRAATLRPVSEGFDRLYSRRGEGTGADMQTSATEVGHESQRRDAQGSRLGQSRHSCHRTREIDA